MVLAKGWNEPHQQAQPLLPIAALVASAVEWGLSDSTPMGRPGPRYSASEDTCTMSSGLALTYNRVDGSSRRAEGRAQPCPWAGECARSLTFDALRLERERGRLP